MGDELDDPGAVVARGGTPARRRALCNARKIGLGPAGSRRSTKSRPPWSRLAATHPASRTCVPMSPGRSWPQRAVR